MGPGPTVRATTKRKGPGHPGPFRYRRPERRYGLLITIDVTWLAPGS